MLTENDKKLLQAKGITEDAIMQQIKRFETGFPFLKIECAATSANGIKVLSNKEFTSCTERWRNYQKSGGSILKFVPASGQQAACSRTYLPSSPMAKVNRKPISRNSSLTTSRILHSMKRSTLSAARSTACQYASLSTTAVM